MKHYVEGLASIPAESRALWAPMEAYYSKCFGDTPVTEVLPIVYVTILPVLSLVMSLTNRLCCIKAETSSGARSTGARVLRRVTHAFNAVQFIQKEVPWIRIKRTPRGRNLRKDPTGDEPIRSRSSSRLSGV